MALEMKKTSRWWYTSVQLNGKRKTLKLTELRGGIEQPIEIRGRRPESLRHPEEGDRLFLESYARAKAAEARLKETLQSTKAVDQQVSHLIATRSGKAQKLASLDSLFPGWRKIPRRARVSKSHEQQARLVLQGFVEFIQERYPEVQNLVEISPVHLRAYLARLDESNASPRTWNVYMQFLKTAFSHLEPDAEGYREFLRKVPKRDENTVHRQPFTDEETQRIMEIVAKDRLLRGPVITAICTAMRKGDCCCLRWDQIQQDRGLIEVRTQKTNELAIIPILPALQEVLEAHRGQDETYCFPKAARSYQDCRSTVDSHFRRMLRQAGFIQSEKQRVEIENRLPQLPKAELMEKGLAYIEAQPFQQRKAEGMKKAFLAYLEGQTLPAIAKQQKVARSTVSLHLNTVEQGIGVEVLRRRGLQDAPEKVQGVTATPQQGQRKNRASVRGWHSFRVSFVTRALSAGMPEELVRKVTGHTAVDIVRKHYFRPDEATLKSEYAKVSPGYLKAGGSPKERMLVILHESTRKTWEADRDQLIDLLESGG